MLSVVTPVQFIASMLRPQNAMAEVSTSISQPRVDVYEGGRRVAVLSSSRRQKVQASHSEYSGRADYVWVYGPTSTEYVFANDQQFRLGQNTLTVVMKTDGPIRVWLKQDFQVKGENASYHYYFSKQEGNSELNNLSSVKFVESGSTPQSQEPRVEVYEGDQTCVAP